jgi:ABC-type amino acid transport substrate-binding protein
MKSSPLITLERFRPMGGNRVASIKRGMTMRFNRLISSVVVMLTFAISFHGGEALAESTAEAIKSRGSMIEGVRFDSPPYGSVDANGQNVGIDIDIANEIAKRLGVKLELIRVTGQSRIPTLNSGKVDLLVAGLTRTAEREKVVDFTMTYITDGGAVVVKKGSTIRAPKDLNGRTVSYVQGTTVDAGLKASAPDAKVTKFQDYPAAFLAFDQGITEAFICQFLGVGDFIRANPEKYEVLTELVAVDPIAIGVRKGDTEWKTELDEILKSIITDGTWATIVKKHVAVNVEPPKLLP